MCMTSLVSRIQGNFIPVNNKIYGKETMSKLLELITNNTLTSTLIGAAIIGLVTWSSRAYKNYRDSEVIFKFLTESAVETPHTFRSTEAIASKTKLTQSRVEELCTKHSKILRNTKEKQSWQIKS